MTLTIRAPRPDEAAALTDLCLRSKASWGYDDAFMTASRASLTVTPERIAAGPCWVAAEEGRLRGVASLVSTELGWKLDLLFIEPDLKRAGIGRALLDRAVGHLRTIGAAQLVIQSDPYAEGFYLRYGAERIGELESDSVPGRMLPLLAFRL